MPSNPHDSGTTGAGCFTENARRANSAAEPEKFNLYNGLSLLAQAVERIEAKAKALDEFEARLERFEAMLAAMERKM